MIRNNNLQHSNCCSTTDNQYNPNQSHRKRPQTSVPAKSPNPPKPWAVAQQKQRAEADLNNDLINDINKEQRYGCLNEFQLTTNKKAMISDIRRLVNSAKSAQDIDLNKKRLKLKEFFAYEEKTHVDELKQIICERQNLEAHERQKQLVAQKDEHERIRKQFVDTKKMQQILETSDIIRPRLRQQLIDETKIYQLAQIEDKKKQNQIEKQYDQLWHEISTRLYNERIEREKQENELSTKRAHCSMLEIMQQISQKEETQREERETERINSKSRKPLLTDKSDEHVAQMKRNQCIEHSIQLKEQRRSKQEADEKYSTENRKLEEIILESIRTEISKEEKRLHDDKLTRNKEARQYLDYLKSVEIERKLSEEELNKLMMEFNGKCEESVLKKRCDFEQKFKAFRQTSHKELLQQIDERKQRRQANFEQKLREAVIENETNAMNLRMNDKQEEINRQNKKLYGQDLNDQIERQKKVNFENEEQERQRLENVRNENEISEKLANIFIQQYDKNILKMHPHLRALTN